MVMGGGRVLLVMPSAMGGFFLQGAMDEPCPVLGVGQRHSLRGHQLKLPRTRPDALMLGWQKFCAASWV